MFIKPKIIYWMFLAILGIIIALPLQAAVIYQHGLGELELIFQKITLMNWIMAGVLLCTAVAIYNVSPWLKVLAPLSVLTVSWNNYLTGAYATDFNMSQALAATGLYMGILLPLFKKDVRFLMNNPKKRWWTRPQRLQKEFPVTLNPYVGNTVHSKVFDISETGAFIKIDGIDFSSIPKIGEHLNLNLTLGTLKKVRCEAVVVRVEESKGIYPRGIGVKFIRVNAHQKKHLSQLLH